MRCKNCNAELAANAKFCIKCGTPVGSTDSMQPAQSSAEISPEADDDGFEPTVFVGNMNAQSQNSQAAGGFNASRSNSQQTGGFNASQNSSQAAGKQIPRSSLPGSNAGMGSAGAGNQNGGKRPDSFTARGTRNSNPRKFLPVAIIAVVAILAVVLFVNRRKTIDLNKYFTASFEGYNGQGEAYAELDKSDRLLSDLFDAAGYSKDSKGDSKEDEIFEKMIMSVIDSAHFEQNSDLKNGDKIKISYSYDNKLAKKYHIRFKGDGKKYKVTGLEEIRSVDPFKYMDLVFEGTSPNVSANPKKKDSNEEFLNGISFEASPSSGLKAGDKVTVTADTPYMSEKEFAERFGCKLTTTTKEYTVENVSEAYFPASDLEGSNALSEAQKQAETVLKADFVQSKDYLSYADLSYEGYYYLTPKDGADPSDNNRLYIIYSATLKPHTEDAQAQKAYLPVAFYNLVKDADGSISVDINNYQRPGEDAVNSLGINGYSSKANMKDDLIVAASTEYEGTENIK